jgi:two-component system phosphate regulon sensor histidine kinase PhoR
MMEDGRFRLAYWIVVPAILIAAGILGYYTFRLAREHTQLGEQTIAQSLLSVAQQRVEQIERYIVLVDNTVFRLIDPNNSGTLDTIWLPEAQTQTPSVRAVLLIDHEGNIIHWASTEDARTRKAFLRVFRQDLLNSLDLASPEPNQLRHVHQRVGDKTYLLSYKAYATLPGQITYVVVYHDTQYLIDEVFPTMFVSDETAPLYNIVDESNQLVFGPALSEVGVYTVHHRFPKTLYEWRLQVAPRQAALLQAQGRSRLRGEVTLPLMSFAIILLGAIFFLYAAEKERRLNVLKSELIANVSHELKTPLSVIRMFGDMLGSGRVPSEQRRHEYLAIICRESERLTSLIDNILDFSALEGGKRPYRLEKGDVAEAVGRALATFRYRSEQDGVEIHVEQSDGLPPVLIDEEAIALAVINLLDNAVKYGGQTPIEVELSKKRSSVEISVRDHGPGIPTESLHRVFERFYRGPYASSARGSGIGLSLVQHIAQAHGGRAWARNAPGGGAIVGFSIPAAMGGSSR